MTIGASCGQGGTSSLPTLATNPAPIVGFSAATDARGSGRSPPVPIPLALGSCFGFQAVKISALPGNPLESSNAVELVIGW